MKKVYSIALLAIIMIVCLQGYNVHLQYQKYKLKCIDEINDMLVQSVDEEYHNFSLECSITHVTYCNIRL